MRVRFFRFGVSRGEAIFQTKENWIPFTNKSARAAPSRPKPCQGRNPLQTERRMAPWDLSWTNRLTALQGGQADCAEHRNLK